MVGERVAIVAQLASRLHGHRVARLYLDDGLDAPSLQRFCELLASDGHLDALQLTGGSSLLNPMYYFRGDVPMAEFIASQPRAVGLGLRLIGHRLFRSYPFEEAFFLPLARQFREALSMPLMLLGGGAGRLPSGRHLVYEDEPSMANLLVTLMDKMGVPVESHGGSTGALPIDTLSGLLG